MKTRAILAIVVLLPLIFTGCGDDDKAVCSIDWSTQPVWDLDTLAIAQEVAVNGIWGVSQNEVYAVGMVDSGQGPIGVVWKYNGTNWSEFFTRPNADLRDIHGVSSHSLWVAGIHDPVNLPGDALVLHWNGSDWEESFLDPSIGGLLAIWAADDHDVYAVDRRKGVIMRYDGVAWTEEATPAQDDPPFSLFDRADVWGIKEGNNLTVYAGLALTENVRGAVLRKSTQGWTIDFQAPDLGYASVMAGVWVASDHHVYALEQTGRGQAPVGRVYHREDTGWAQVSPPFYRTELVNAIRGDQSGNLVVLGPRIYHLAENAWEEYLEYPGTGLVSLHDLWIKNAHIFIGGTTALSSTGVVLHGDFSRGCSR